MPTNQIELQRIKKIVSRIIENSWKNNMRMTKLSLISVGVQELKRQIGASQDNSVRNIKVKDLQLMSISIVNKLINERKISPLG